MSQDNHTQGTDLITDSRTLEGAIKIRDDFAKKHNIKLIPDALGGKSDE